MKTAGAVAVVIAWLASAVASCSPRGDFERMRQQRIEPYSTNAAFGDRVAMRVPPAGAVAIEPAQAASPTSGARDFASFCSVCHGDDGSGQSVMAIDIPGTPPPSLASPAVVAKTDDELFAVVTHGRNRMPAFEWALPATERRAVVGYVRTLQRGGGASGDEALR